MTRIVRREQIEAVLPTLDLLPAMEQAFVAWSSGRAVVPPVGEMLFSQPPGEVHLKYGYVHGDLYYVVKIASGFYQNPALGLPSSNGLMLLFSQATGELVAVLLDEGMLTDQRTAAAGAVAAKYFAPEEIALIGMIGTGIQAELQLRHLLSVTGCRDVLVWGRGAVQFDALRQRLADTTYRLRFAENPAQVARSCQLIVTTTPATVPLLDELAPGTHVTAVGSDTAEKQELSPALLAQADVVAVDSRAQAASRGEVFRAVSAGALNMASVIELGEVIGGSSPGRTHAGQITVVDLTGVATQDIAIATAIYRSVTHAD